MLRLLLFGLGVCVHSASLLDLNYYEMLEVDQSASVAEVKKAYRKLALQYHPDKSPRDLSEEEKTEREQTFMRLANAYEVLSDETMRGRYNIGLRRGEKTYNPQMWRRRPDGTDEDFAFNDAYAQFEAVHEVHQEIAMWVSLAFVIAFSALPFCRMWRRRLKSDTKRGAAILDKINEEKQSFGKSQSADLHGRIVDLFGQALEAIRAEQQQRLAEQQALAKAKGAQNRNSTLAPAKQKAQAVARKTAPIHDMPGEKDKESTDEWTPEQQIALEKALKSVPQSGKGGIGDIERWERISALVPGKSKKQCIKRFKGIREQIAAAALSRQSENVFETFQRKPASEEGSNSNPAEPVPAAAVEANACASIAPLPDALTASTAALIQDDVWTVAQQQALEQAIRQVQTKGDDRWDIIATLVPGKNKKQCVRRFKQLRDEVAARTAARNRSDG